MGHSSASAYEIIILLSFQKDSVFLHQQKEREAGVFQPFDEGKL
jgi:hypothetical protein